MTQRMGLPTGQLMRFLIRLPMERLEARVEAGRSAYGSPGVP